MNLKVKNQITTENYYSDKQAILRRINTNIFSYLFFFTAGLILVIVAAIMYGQGVNYPIKEQSVYNDSTLVLYNASISLFIVGGLLIGFPIFIDIYVIYKIYKIEILKNNVPKYVLMMLIVGVVFQITTFIGMIFLYEKLKQIYLTHKND